MSEEETLEDLKLFYKNMSNDFLELRIELAKFKASSCSKFLKELKELKQGSMSVKEYFDEMHIAMLRAKVRENSEATMDRFLNGLNPSIAKQMELYPYSDIKGMVSIAIELEKLMKKKESNREKEKMKKEREKYEKELEEKRKIECERENKRVDVTQKKYEEKEEKKNENNFEKSEVESDCKDISILTNDLNHCFPFVNDELQVLGDLFPNKPPDSFLPIWSIEPSYLTCQDSRTNLFEEGENDSIQIIVQNRYDKAQQAVQNGQQNYWFGTPTWRMMWIIAWRLTCINTCVEFYVTRGRPPPKPPWHMMSSMAY